MMGGEDGREGGREEKMKGGRDLVCSRSILLTAISSKYNWSRTLDRNIGNDGDVWSEE